MTTKYTETITKIQHLPLALVQEVDEFINWLLLMQTVYQEMKQTSDDMTDYLKNLEDYEEQLAKGEIQW
jgi:hypothetical protein